MGNRRFHQLIILEWEQIFEFLGVFFQACLSIDELTGFRSELAWLNNYLTSLDKRRRHLSIATLQKSKGNEKNSEIDRESLNGIRSVISARLFKPDSKLAFLSILLGISFHFFTLAVSYLVWKENWMILFPLAWFLMGTSVTSLFVLGHDCAHGSFLKSQNLNDVLGHFFFLFSGYPYFAWKFSHNAHHKDTNLLESNSENVYYDNAWIPLTVEQYRNLQSVHPFLAKLFVLGRTVPPIGSLMHNVLIHFFPRLYFSVQRKKVYFSYMVLLLGFISFSAFIYLFMGSIFAIFHFLIFPALFFQFWMSTYTYQHHTSETMQFYSKSEWNPYKAQILSTLNVLFPRVISYLHFGIDVHTPHHLSTAIPCYHLREAYQEIKESQYGKDILEEKFSWKVFSKRVQNCHLWSLEKKGYLAFKDI